MFSPGRPDGIGDAASSPAGRRAPRVRRPRKTLDVGDGGRLPGPPPTIARPRGAGPSQSSQSFRKRERARRLPQGAAARIGSGTGLDRPEAKHERAWMRHGAALLHRGTAPHPDAIPAEKQCTAQVRQGSMGVHPSEHILVHHHLHVPQIDLPPTLHDRGCSSSIPPETPAHWVRTASADPAGSISAAAAAGSTRAAEPTAVVTVVAAPVEEIWAKEEPSGVPE
jgi:hypothetical protein